MADSAPPLAAVITFLDDSHRRQCELLQVAAREAIASALQAHEKTCVTIAEIIARTGVELQRSHEMTIEHVTKLLQDAREAEKKP